MSREEAAAKAYVGTFFDEDQDMTPDRIDRQRMAQVLAAADAHDQANGIHRIALDDATVERAAHALYESRTGNLGTPIPESAKTRWLYEARVVLAAAVQEDGQ